MTAKEETSCPDGLLPDGETCPRCGQKRAPSGVNWGTWVHVRVPAPAPKDRLGPGDEITHTRGCGIWNQDGSDEDCTCGLKWRQQLAERDAELERLRKRDALNTELVSGIERQLGIYGADATTTICAEIEKLKTERDKAIENFNDYRSERECDVSSKEAREAPHHCGELDKGCSCFKCRLHRQASTIRSLTQQLAERDAEVARLKEELAFLNATHATTNRKLLGHRDFLEAANAELRKRVGQLEQHRDLYAKATIHRCKKCGCLWRRWGDGSWSLLDRHQVCKSCCDNEVMGEQIEEIEIGLEYKRLVEELHKGKQP